MDPEQLVEHSETVWSVQSYKAIRPYEIILKKESRLKGAVDWSPSFDFAAEKNGGAAKQGKAQFFKTELLKSNSQDDKKFGAGLLEA